MRRLFLLMAIIGLIGPCAAQDQEKFDLVGSFFLPLSDPRLIILAGDITAVTPLDFKRALQKRPNAETIELASNGGSVYSGLVMAAEIHERGLNTHIPEGYGCFSACAYLYFAGAKRRIDGELGVHQIATEGEALTGGDAQVAVADIIETISSFGVDRGVITVMLRTPPDGMHVFTRDEIADLSLERYVVPDGLADTRSLPAPRVAVVPNSTPTFDPTAVTVVSKTVDDQNLGRSERILTLNLPAQFDEVLVKNGFTDLMIQAIDQARSIQFADQQLPAGAVVRVLFGPSRSSDALIPYRLSIYLPVGKTLALHRVTVALNDNGQYVLSIEPMPIKMGDVAVGAARYIPAKEDPSYPGKSSRGLNVNPQ